MSDVNKVKHFKDLGFTVLAKPESHHVDYVIYDHEGFDDQGNPLFPKANSSVSPDPVKNIEDSEPYLHGSVKWDGCSNWHFDEQERIMLHGCCKEDIERFGKVMGECWEWTKELCPNWLD
jgi:hypothetical protein